LPADRDLAAGLERDAAGRTGRHGRANGEGGDQQRRQREGPGGPAQHQRTRVHRSSAASRIRGHAAIVDPSAGAMPRFAVTPPRRVDAVTETVTYHGAVSTTTDYYERLGVPRDA